MHGILIIDKPAGMTSHDVVARVRRKLKTRRVGHTGTLDPFATGVLVLLIGNATRLAQYAAGDFKEYEAAIQFGWETDTGDVTGVRSAECGMRNEEIAHLLSVTDWERLLAKFRGDTLQTPPMYSAKKIEGRKLYELARKGVEIEREPVKISITTLELIEPAPDDPATAIRVRVVCSAGTYIRTLAEDIGRALRVGAHLTELRRTGAGRFRIEHAHTLEQLDAMADPSNVSRPLAEIVDHLPVVKLSSDRAGRTRDGLSTRVEIDGLEHGEPVRMLDEDSRLIAIGTYDDEQKTVKPKIVLV